MATDKDKPLYDIKEARDAFRDTSNILDSNTMVLLTAVVGGVLVFLSNSSKISFSGVEPFKSTDKWLKVVLAILLSALLFHYVSLVSARQATYLLASDNKSQVIVDKVRRWNYVTGLLNWVVAILMALALTLLIYLTIFGRYSF